MNVMSWDNLDKFIFVIVSRYVAAACLVSIAVWGAGMYLWAKDWYKRVRDAGIFLLVIGVLTGVLALKPEKMDAYFWPPVTWFSLSMLIVMELLWIAFLFESLLRWCKSIGKRGTEPPHRPPIYTHYPEI